MKLIGKAFVSVVVAGCALVSYASTPSPVGIWKGRVTASLLPKFLPKNMKPEEVAQLQARVAAEAKKITVTLTLDKSGTYKVTTVQPTGAKVDGKGKWKLVGKTLTMYPSGKGRSPEVGTLSANGKTLSVPLPKESTERGLTGKAVFVRA